MCFRPVTNQTNFVQVVMVKITFVLLSHLKLKLIETNSVHLISIQTTFAKLAQFTMNVLLLVKIQSNSK